MDIESMTTIGRIAERLLIVIFGGSSLVMGWHLYVKGVEKKQVAEIKHENTIIRLKDVGPGAFFCFLGALVLVTALVNSVLIKSEVNIPKKPGEENSKTEVIYGFSIKSGPPTEDVVVAITTVLNNVHPDQMALNAQWKIKGLEQALSKLTEVKEALLLDEFPTYNEYLTIKNSIKIGKEPKFASSDDEKTYRRIEAIETKQFGQEP